jgi:hypothetical protein
MDSLWDCEMCGKRCPDYSPQMCCDGRECGCRGQPIEPCICSQECWDAMLARNAAPRDIEVHPMPSQKGKDSL